MKLAEIMAAFDAVEIEPRPVAPTVPCLQCDRPTVGYMDGRPCLCLPCTVADLGENLYDLSIRREFGLSRATYERRLEQYGPPYVNRLYWTTPKSKLRR